MNNIIQPKTLPGTMELLPREQLLFNEVKNKIEKVYQSFGFLPLDTPIIESSNGPRLIPSLKIGLGKDFDKYVDKYQVPDYQ